MTRRSYTPVTASRWVAQVATIGGEAPSPAHVSSSAVGILAAAVSADSRSGSQSTSASPFLSPQLQQLPPEEPQQQQQLQVQQQKPTTADGEMRQPAQVEDQGIPHQKTSRGEQREISPIRPGVTASAAEAEGAQQSRTQSASIPTVPHGLSYR